jgi:hypothetical protein
VKDYFLTIYGAATRPREAYRDLAANPPRSAQAALVGVLALLLVLLGVFIAKTAWAFVIFAGLLAFNWIAPRFSQNRSLAWSALWLSLSPVLLIAGIASPFLVLGLAQGWLSPAGMSLPLLASFNPILYLLFLVLSLTASPISTLGPGGWAAILVVAVQAAWHFVWLYIGAKELSNS